MLQPLDISGILTYAAVKIARPEYLDEIDDNGVGLDHGAGHPFCFWTAQKHLTIERTMGLRT
jgi:hypothetical protein